MGSLGVYTKLYFFWFSNVTTMKHLPAFKYSMHKFMTSLKDSFHLSTYQQIKKQNSLLLTCSV